MTEASAQSRIRITSEWGTLTATLADNEAGRALARTLPLTLETHDHLRQEKVGTLPRPLPEIARQRGFQPGTLGIWNADRFVIYYVRGEVPNPGIMIVGQVEGDAAIYNRPGSITVRIERID
ncbi:MAG: cyclophilin-like fold protein [Ferrovibrio sp.]